MNEFLKDGLRYSGYTILGIVAYICFGLVFRCLQHYNPILGIAYLIIFGILFIGFGMAWWKKYIGF